LWTENQSGEKINYFKGSSERDEALFITEKIQNLIENQEYTPSDIAILYRTNAQSRAIEDTFMKSNISYQLIGCQRFYDRKEIKDMITYLPLLTHQDVDISYELL